MLSHSLLPARALLLGSLLLLGSCKDSHVPAVSSCGTVVPTAAAPERWPTDNWQTDTPEAQGFCDGALDTLADDAAAALPYYTSLLVIRNGVLVHESYNGTVPDTADPITVDTPHHVWSVTKSVTSLTLGRAWTLGDLDEIDVTAGDVFPAAAFGALAGDDPRRGITLRHVLQMRSGLAWNEDAWLLTDKDPLFRTFNGEFADCVDEDTVLLCGILHQDLIHGPGTVWNYNTYDSYLISGFFKSLAGVRLDEYANQHLFAPLGIATSVDWLSIPPAYTFGGGTLSLRSRDLAKLGLLVQYDGQWDGQQLIATDWLTQSLQAQSSGQVAAFEPATGNPAGSSTQNIPYGWQWWRVTGPELGGLASISARGLGGQMVHIFRDKGLIILITCDSDSATDRAADINTFLKTHVLDRLAN